MIFLKERLRDFWQDFTGTDGLGGNTFAQPSMRKNATVMLNGSMKCFVKGAIGILAA